MKAIVSDQGSNFDKFAKVVKKITVENPYFMYDDTKIYYIEQIYKDQKERKRLIPKTTDFHIQPNNFQRMTVKFTVLTLSRTRYISNTSHVH